MNVKNAQLSLMLLLVVSLSGGGCASTLEDIPYPSFSALNFGGWGGSTFELASTSRKVDPISSNFSTMVYGYHDDDTLEFILIEGEADDPDSAVYVTMNWRPRAGKTPLDPRATNATIEYAVFKGEGTGIYGGAGFLQPYAKPGGATLNVEIRNSALRLADASEQFKDTLGLAEAKGGFTATRDGAKLRRLLRKVRVKVAKDLGYPAFAHRQNSSAITVAVGG